VAHELPAQRSFDDLGTPLAAATFCVLDLETTGGNRHDDLITEIGAVKVRCGEVIGTFQTLVNPGRAIPPQVSVITGLTDSIVADAPRIESVLPSLLSFLGDAVFVGHNVKFDLGFVQAALDRSGRDRWKGSVVDTLALARRLVRDEVPNCRLGTLARKFRFPHQPSHRALDDALATTDLLHLLIERASGLGVTGLDDLVAFTKLGGHPQSAKLRLTADLPRRPGVYIFTGHSKSVLYAGKATNLRQRVRSYFGSDDRRKIGPMLNETQGIEHIELPDPLTAEVVETRIIARLRPRYNHRGTTTAKYCYVRLDLEQPWPRLSIVKKPAPSSIHLGPLPSRRMATLVVEALHTAIPLRRCTQRLSRDHQPAADASVCSTAQLGVARCPCAGNANPAKYAALVVDAARVFGGDPTVITAQLRQRMTTLAASQRFEEAAMTRDRLAALLGAVQRTELMHRLVEAAQAEVAMGDTTWIIDRGRLLDTRSDGRLTAAISIAPGDPIEPGLPVPVEAADEVLVLARHFDRHAEQLRVEASGPWRFPLELSTDIKSIRHAA